MVDWGGLGSMGTKMLMSWGFWLILVVVIFLVAIGSLYLRKKGKFIYPAVVYTDTGNGKLNLRFTRAGWFKSKKLLGGLIDYAGERRLEIKDGRFIQQGSTSDLHQIEFNAGVLLQEKPDDPKILVPISKAHLSADSQRMIMEIAPADYRDACSKIIADSEKETLSRWETLANVLVFGLVGVVLFISIILTIQYVKNTMADANEIHKEAMGFYDKVLQRMSAVPSETAP